MKEVFEISGFCGNCKRRGIYGCREDILIADVCSYIHEATDVDAIPVAWILGNERMPKNGIGRDAILDMIEAWEEQNNDH